VQLLLVGQDTLYTRSALHISEGRSKTKMEQGHFGQVILKVCADSLIDGLLCQCTLGSEKSLRQHSLRQ